MTDEKVIERITKLLAMAEDKGATQAEAESFMAKAQQMMTKHAIELAMIRAAGKAPTGEPERLTIEVGRTWFMPTAHLIGHIANANDCQSYYVSPGQRGPGRVTIVGFPEDLDNVELLYGSLSIQLARFVKDVRSDRWDVSDQQVRRSFRFGFATGIGQRLAEARRETVDAADAAYSGTLLPALVDKAAAVQAAMPDNMKKARRSTVMAGSYHQGVQAAGRADIGNPAVAGAAGAIGAGR